LVDKTAPTMSVSSSKPSSNGRVESKKAGEECPHEGEKKCLPKLPENLHVLVADDQKSNRTLLKFILEKKLQLNWRVSLTQTAEEAVDLIKTGDDKVDLMIIDENFGKEDAMLGSEAIELLRQSSLTYNLSIILCSANAKSAYQDSICSTCNSVIEFNDPPPRNGPDVMWDKPLPRWTDGTMQKSLLKVIESRKLRSCT